MRYLLLKIIRLYQKTLSPDHGFLAWRKPYGFCRFYPTCSEYGYQAIRKFGAWNGLFLAGKRILRCHPWSRGGYDPVK
ncbi:membrane protein insertion efficiency factor YidD [bacterium (Candidatus Torokbacteria) CG09_land_8_20_14_0_10_42_11]|nr:MAG: membrane protein insertion efficiency factor YidD [bacterium (Candidatus Torokbacteria) CG09_land_8_20_14_0_10_42_11]